MEILTTYVRENAPWKEEEQPSDEDTLPSEPQPTQDNQSPPKLATNVQAIQVDGEHMILWGSHLEGEDLRNAHPKLATDIQAILTVLGRRTQTYGDGEDQRLDLTGTDL
jgi:hypothetical protein